MAKRQPMRFRKIAVTCIECDRPYETTIRVGDPLPSGRCVRCAGNALLAKCGEPLIGFLPDEVR